MKLKKAEILGLSVTLAFLLLTGGYHWLRNRVPAEFEIRAGSPAEMCGPAAIDLNTADEETLCSLPGIGPVLARRIIDYRETNGPFAAPEDITRVRGIGESIYNGICDSVTVK